MTEVEELTVALTAAKEREDVDAVKELKVALFEARKRERTEQVSNGTRGQGLVSIQNNTEEGV